jgi:integrase
MARRSQKHWSYRTGEKGVNRVRVFAHRLTGKLYLEFYDHGRRLTEPVGHADKAEAKAQAERVASALRAQSYTQDEPVTLQQLFDNYEREVTPRKSAGKAAHDRRTSRITLEILGGARPVAALTHRDAARFVTERRRQGDLRKGSKCGRVIGPRQLIYDLAFLHVVFNWGIGGGFIDKDPWRGFKPALGKYTPRRPVLTGKQYRALLTIADQVAPGFRLALVLAHETGHRIGAIRQLRWSDVDLGRGVIRWRVEHDKIGLEHETPLTRSVRQTFGTGRHDDPAIGERWVFPAPKNPAAPVSRFLVDSWWDRAETLADLPPEPGRGWHSCRRTFATELKAAQGSLCLGRLEGPANHPQVLSAGRPGDDAARVGDADGARSVEQPRHEPRQTGHPSK